MINQFSGLTITEENPQLPFFKEKGYLTLPSLFSENFVGELLHKVRSRLHQCAKELSCSYEDYLQAASRWIDPSPVTMGLEHLILKPLKSCLESLMEDVCELVKLNVISKTPSSPASLPFHQDISYSPHSPYQFSAWLALTDAPSESGPLEVIIGSHRGEIEPAIDFWDPDYQDLNSKKGIKQKIPAKAGDLILFDSCLWHGSGRSESFDERLALVTRWKTKGYDAPYIPPFEPKPFGMWTCQRRTEEILAKSLKLFSRKSVSDYLNLLDQWEKILDSSSLAFLENNEKAQEDLRRVRLLHLAHQKHNGGDAQGILYAQLWHSFLKPLSFYLNERQGDLYE